MELITGKTGLPHVQAADDAELYRLFLGDGDYILPTGLQLEAQLNGASKIRIYDGSLIAQGRLAKIRTSTGFDELDLAPGVIGQKRADLIVAEYSKVQEEAIDAWIVGDSPLAIDWLSETEGGTPFTPIKGQLYRLMNTVGIYEEGTYYRWHGNVYVRSLVQELEHCETKVIQGAYNSATFIAPTYVTGDIDLGEVHQVPLWEVRFNGINFESLTDRRIFLDGVPYDTLIAHSQAVYEQANARVDDALAQVETSLQGINDYLSDELNRLKTITAIAPLTVITARNVNAVVGSDVEAGNLLLIRFVDPIYTFSSDDIFVLYLNGLRVMNDDIFKVSDFHDASHDYIHVYLYSDKGYDHETTYDEVQLEVWRPKTD